jgi:hypothetical protein
MSDDTIEPAADVATGRDCRSGIQSTLLDGRAEAGDTTRCVWAGWVGSATDGLIADRR